MKRPNTTHIDLIDIHKCSAHAVFKQGGIFIVQYQLRHKSSWFQPRRWSNAMGKSVRLACGRLGVRILTATDISRKNRSDSSTAKSSAIGVSVTGPR